MKLEDFYEGMQSGLINISKVAELLDISLPTAYKRRDNKELTYKEIMTLKALGYIDSFSDADVQEWGNHVLELVRDTDIDTDIEDPITRSIEFERWKAFKRLNIND